MLSLFRLLQHYYEQKKITKPKFQADSAIGSMFNLLVLIPFYYLIFVLSMYFTLELSKDKRSQIMFGIFITLILAGQFLSYGVLNKIKYTPKIDIKKTRKNAYVFLVVYYFVIIFISVILYGNFIAL